MEKDNPVDYIRLKRREDPPESETEGTIEVTQLKKHFNIWAAIGINYSISVTPLTVGCNLALAIGVGGSPMFFYRFVFTGFFQLILCLALAEMSSAMPSSSGPAHWAEVLGGERLGPVIGYLMGWATNACWFFISAYSFVLNAQLIMALIRVTNPSYSPPAWHTYLLYCALTVQGAAINLPKAHHAVDWALKSMVVLVNGSGLFILVSLLVRAHPKPTARTVFVDIVDETGWDSNFVVFFLNILPGLAAVGGLDSAVHLTDEVEGPGRMIPIAMLSSAGLSYLVGIPSILAYLFSITDAQALLEPVGGQPLFQIFHDSYDSMAFTIAASCCVIIAFTISSWAALLSWNRLYWSFSRDGGLPFSEWTAKVSSTDAIPVNALVVNTVLVLLVGALQLKASTVLNAVLGAASLCGAVSFGVPTALLLWRGRTHLDQRRWLNLGRLGYVVDWIAMIWQAWACVWTCFPLYIPVTATSMNYASAVFGVIVCISAVFYIFPYRHRLNRIGPRSKFS